MNVLHTLKHASRYLPALVPATVMVLIFALPVTGQEIPVPVRTQMSLFRTLLSFERNHTVEDGDRIDVAIVYQSKFRKSLAVQEEIVLFLKENNKPGGISFQLIDLDLDGDASQGILLKKPFAAFLICPLRSVSVTVITEISRRRKVLSMSIVPEYVKKGVSVGIDLNGDRPLILINRASAKLENADFDSRLLHLAKIIDSTDY